MSLLFPSFGGIFFIIVLAIFILPAIFYMRTLSNTLKSISPQNRKMPPENVWLLFIPLFNLVWHFIVVGKVSESIKAELTSRKAFHKLSEEKNAYSFGLATCIINLCLVVPVLGNLASLGALVCFIIYWIKINEFKTFFTSSNKYYEGYDENSIF